MTNVRAKDQEFRLSRRGRWSRGLVQMGCGKWWFLEKIVPIYTPSSLHEHKEGYDGSNDYGPACVVGSEERVAKANQIY